MLENLCLLEKVVKPLLSPILLRRVYKDSSEILEMQATGRRTLIA